MRSVAPRNVRSRLVDTSLSRKPLPSVTEPRSKRCTARCGPSAYSSVEFGCRSLRTRLNATLLLSVNDQIAPSETPNADSSYFACNGDSMVCHSIRALPLQHPGIAQRQFLEHEQAGLHGLRWRDEGLLADRVEIDTFVLRAEGAFESAVGSVTQLEPRVGAASVEYGADFSRLRVRRVCSRSWPAAAWRC